MKYAVVVAAVLLGAIFASGCGTLNPTQQKYANIGKSSVSDLFNECGIKWAEGAIAGTGVAVGTANGDAAWLCFQRVAVAKGFQVVLETAKDILIGVTGGGWFGSAEPGPKHETIYTFRLVKPLD